MGESGMTIAFPMTKEEIAAEDAENAGREALRTARARRPKPKVVKIELPESGHTILFPAADTEDSSDGAVNPFEQAGK